MSDGDQPPGPIRGPESWFTEESGSLELPHWTEPGSGAVDAADAGPRWRDGASDYNELDDIRLLDPTAGHGDEMGAAGEVFFGLESPDEFAAPQAPPVVPVVGPAGGPASASPSAAAVVPGTPIVPESAQPGAIQGAAVSGLSGQPGQPAAPARRRNRPVPETGQRASSGSDRDMTMATVTGLGLAAVALASLWIGEVPGLVVATAILALATMEFYAAMRKVGYNPATLLGLGTTVGLTVGAYWKNVAAYPIVLFLAVVFALLWYLMPVGPGRPVPNLGITLLGIAYVGVLGSFAGLLLSSDSIAVDAETGIAGFQSYGTGALFAAILATVAYDIGAYVVGRSIGRTPLSSASPNKTLEGVVGGAVVSILITAVVVGGFGIAPWGGGSPGGFTDSLILGVVAAVAATLGDLCESMMKRDLGVKDMGTMLPGHGGILDRFDGLLFVMPATWCAGLAIGIFEATSVVSA